MGIAAGYLFNVDYDLNDGERHHLGHSIYKTFECYEKMVCEVDCLKQSLHQEDLNSLESLPAEAVRIVNRICISVSTSNPLVDLPPVRPNPNRF